MTVKAQATDPRNIAAVSLAAIGLANWLLSSYVFHGTTPAPVATALYVVLPAAVGYLMTHIALNTFPPKLTAQMRRNFQQSMKNNVTAFPEKTHHTAPAPAPPQDAA
jgi:hypothetical protein